MLIEFLTPEGTIKEDITGKPLLHILDLVSHNVAGINIVPDDREPATQILGTRLLKTSNTDSGEENH